MDKQQIANILQEQLDKISPLYDLNPDDPQFELWKEDCITIFNEFFADEKRWIDSFDWNSFRVGRIKTMDELGFFTEEDREAYIKGLQGTEVAIKAALRKLELFGIKPQAKDVSASKGITIQVVNNLTNQQTATISITFEQIITSIDSSHHTDEEKNEAKQKVQDLN